MSECPASRSERGAPTGRLPAGEERADENHDDEARADDGRAGEGRVAQDCAAEESAQEQIADENQVDEAHADEARTGGDHDAGSRRSEIRAREVNLVAAWCLVPVRKDGDGSLRPARPLAAPKPFRPARHVQDAMRTVPCAARVSAIPHPGRCNRRALAWCGDREPGRASDGPRGPALRRAATWSLARSRPSHRAGETPSTPS